MRVIDRAAEARQPCFLYLAHHAPHTPIEAKPGDMAHFKAKLRPGLSHQNPTYAAMARSLDESVGRVLARLRERGLEKNTLVIFASDNGGHIGTDQRQTMPVTSNAPLRSGKGTLYEGGLRVPLLVRWPGVTPGGAQCGEAAVLTDLFATLLRKPDTKLEREALFFHYPPSSPASAVRAWPWKLIEFFEDDHVELYNLRDDPAEEHDLAKQLPDKATALRLQRHAWRESTGAALPRPNPDFKQRSNP